MRYGFEDIAPLLTWLTVQQAPSVLIGGLAVGVWVHHLLPDPIAIQSKDVDFRGPRFLAAAIQQWGIANGMRTGQIVRAIRKNAPQAGKVFNFPLNPNGPDAVFKDELVIEVLERLPLLDGTVHEIPNGSILTVRNIRLLDPMSLMICKLHAAHRLNDIKHLELLCRVIPAFLEIEAPKHAAYDPRVDIDRLRGIIGRPEWTIPFENELSRGLRQCLEARGKQVVS